MCLCQMILGMVKKKWKYLTTEKRYSVLYWREPIIQLIGCLLEIISEYTVGFWILNGPMIYSSNTKETKISSKLWTMLYSEHIM